MVQVIKMDFRVYPSIENEYRAKFIDYFIERFPEIETQDFVIQEKIHGANFRLGIQFGGNIMIGSRTQDLTMVEKDHFGLKRFLDAHNDIMVRLKNYSLKVERSFTIFGEIFGGSIQKDIDYGNGRWIRLFDIWFEDDDAPVPAIDFQKIMDNIGLVNFSIENLATVPSLQDALDFDINFPSTFGISNEVICEGIVIKPAKRNFMVEGGAIFYLKKKNKKFLETKIKRKKVKKPPSDKLISLHKEFIRYITPQRLANIFSKEGKIKSKKEIKKYLDLMVQDAKDEFLKDFDISGFSTAEHRNIFNANKEIVALLKNEMK